MFLFLMYCNKKAFIWMFLFPLSEFNLLQHGGYFRAMGPLFKHSCTVINDKRWKIFQNLDVYDILLSSSSSVSSTQSVVTLQFQDWHELATVDGDWRSLCQCEPMHCRCSFLGYLAMDWQILWTADAVWYVRVIGHVDWPGIGAWLSNCLCRLQWVLM